MAGSSGGSGGGSSATGRAQSLWGMSQTTSYDPRKVYSKASDQHGHSKQIVANVMPDIQAALMRLVNDPAWPEYESLQDVARDACHHLIHLRKDQQSLPEDREAARDLLKMVAREERVEHLIALVRRHQHVQHRLETVLVDLLRAEAWAIMRATLEEEEEEILTLPEPFRTKAMEQIRAWRAKLPKEK